MSQMIEFQEKIVLMDQVMLVQIAHETQDSEVKKFALMILRNYLDRPIPTQPNDAGLPTADDVRGILASSQPSEGK